MAALFPQGQNAQVQGMGQAQRAFLGTIEMGMSSVGQAQAELESKAQLPQLGSDGVSMAFSAAATLYFVLGVHCFM